ncbi:MAG: family 43 glycosylhydrolase [Eubacterium sp.]|nr:family 43 glycosylhydrolase [Eubacterium sp.]
MHKNRFQTKKLVSCILTGVLALATVLSPATPFTSTTSEAATPTRVSVHDPSIAVAKDGTYYVFGSHIDAAKSTDLINWTRFTNGYAKTNNKLYGDLSNNLKKSFAWAGEKDCDAKNFSVWAPDVFWNKDYVNKDGSKGAYMIYACTSSTYIRSAIFYAVSQNIEGPYTFVDTLVYSGFTKADSYDNGSKINKNYKNTNIDELIADGTLKDGVNSSWFSGNAFNNLYAPNAIDPTIFQDKEGKLWMTYGSWSGGIFILEIDPATGKAIYPGKNSTTADGLVVDEYFGTRIAGGYRRSGEGPYVVYDKESDYYYLYVSYEGLAQEGGYNMRLFRSKNPDGPYVDATGTNAAMKNGAQSHSKVGIKVMGNYKLPYLDTTGYMAPGHNSALIDDKDGGRYLIYHTRFQDKGEAHQVRVHQQFLNEEGWPVTAVYENKGDKISATGYATDDIVGDYAFIDHGTENDRADVRQAKNIRLLADGTISGDIKGTWTKKDGTYYMNATIDGAKYSGVFFEQTVETSSVKAMTFTAIGNNNHTIWGVKKPVSLKSSASTLYVGGNQGKTAKLSLDGVTGKSYTVTYSSSKKSVATVSKSGKVTAKKKGTTKITAVVKMGDITKTVTKTIKVKKAYIKLTKKKKTLKTKKKYTYKAKGYGIKASSIKWSSSNKSVLSISKKGKAVAKKPGKATVTAKYKKIKATVKVTVKKK